MPNDAKRTQIVDKILDALGELVTLRIVTIQGTPSIGTGAQGQADVEIRGKLDDLKITPEVVVATSLDLAQGDIKSFVPADFFDAGKSELRAYHSEQVRLAREIVEKNVGALADLVGRLSGSEGEQH